MSITITISDEIAQHLNTLSLGETSNLDEKLRMLLMAEYRRRLTHYNLTDRRLSQRYKMKFADFEQQEITKQHGYTWDVESDAIAWETAVDGISTMQRQLAELGIVE